MSLRFVPRLSKKKVLRNQCFQLKGVSQYQQSPYKLKLDTEAINRRCLVRRVFFLTHFDRCSTSILLSVSRFFMFSGDTEVEHLLKMGLKCCRIHSKTPVLHVLKETLIQVFSCNISQNPCGWLLLKTPLYSTFPLEGLLKELPSQTSHILVFLFVFLCSVL